MEDGSSVIKDASLRTGTARAANWNNTSSIPGFSQWTAKDLAEVGRGEEVIEYFRAVDDGAFA